MMTLHETFGKFFTSFENSTCFRRADNWDVCQSFIVFEEIVYSFYQWIFRTYHYHVDVVFYHKLFDGIKIVGFNSYVFAYFECTGISGCNI